LVDSDRIKIMRPSLDDIDCKAVLPFPYHTESKPRSSSATASSAGVIE
jgi:hypothetical protein